MSRLPSLLAAGALALAGCLWGTGFYFGKIAFREMSVVEDVTWRFVFASLLLVPALFRSRRRFSRKDWGLILLTGFVGIPAQFLVQFQGLKLTTVSHASLMVGTLPMLLALSSVVLLGEHLKPAEWVMLIASGAGAMLIALSGRGASKGPHPSVRGDLLVLLSMIAAGAAMLLSKRLMERYPPLQVTTMMILAGTVFLLIEATISGKFFRFDFSIRVWSAAAAQGILATALAYLLWNWGLARVPVSRSGVFLNFEPLVGAILGVTLLDERLGAAAAFGGGLILGSAVYFTRRSSE